MQTYLKRRGSENPTRPTYLRYNIISASKSNHFFLGWQDDFLSFPSRSFLQNIRTTLSDCPTLSNCTEVAYILTKRDNLTHLAYI